MKKLRIVICDDNPTELANNVALCRIVCAENRVDMELKEYTSGDDLLLDLENPKFYSTVNIMLLDINMPGTNGLEVARQARAIGYRGVILFITVSKSDIHFKQAFDVNAINYYNKGDSVTRFKELLVRAIQAVEDMEADIFTVSCSGRVKQIVIKNILYFDINQRIVTVHYFTSRNATESFEFYMPFAELEGFMHDKGFMRIHRNYLVSLEKIQEYSFKEVTMSNGDTVPVGRSQYSDLKEALLKLRSRQ